MYVKSDFIPSSSQTHSLSHSIVIRNRNSRTSTIVARLVLDSPDNQGPHPRSGQHRHSSSQQYNPSLRPSRKERDSTTALTKRRNLRLPPLTLLSLQVSISASWRLDHLLIECFAHRARSSADSPRTGSSCPLKPLTGSSTCCATTTKCRLSTGHWCSCVLKQPVP